MLVCFARAIRSSSHHRQPPAAFLAYGDDRSSVLREILQPRRISGRLGHSMQISMMPRGLAAIAVLMGASEAASDACAHGKCEAEEESALLQKAMDVYLHYGR
eukprot:gb/GFBE01013801.1/.p1 GENE.gb/GFBE01013801.1/~~gb/GFBE01013801.1/.p1  ORF type:complete len:103 (+),score=18.86 gb/GFBE01013801.1/:3-311(+)